MRFPGDAERAHGHALVLSQEGRGHVRPVLLHLHLGVDTALPELALDEGEGVEHVGAVASGDGERRLQALGEARLGQEPPGLLGIVAVVLGARPELVDARGPLGQAPPDGRRGLAPKEDGLDDGLPIDGVRDGPAHAHVVEGRLVRPHEDAGRHVGQEVLVDVLGMSFLERGHILLPDSPPVPGAAVDLSRAVGGLLGGLVLHDQPVHAVDPGLARPEVIRVAAEDGFHIGLVALQDERAGAHGRLGPLEIPVLVHHLPGDDPGPGRVGQHVEEPDEGLLEPEPHGVAVHDVDPVDGVEHEPERVGLLGQEAVEGELDVLGDQLTPVERRPVLPAHALAQVKDHGGVVRLFPALGQVGLDGEGPRGDPGADLVADELVVDEAQRVVGLQVQGLVGVEVRRIVAADAENAPAPGLLGPERARGQDGLRPRPGPRRPGRPSRGRGASPAAKAADGVSP